MMFGKSAPPPPRATDNRIVLRSSSDTAYVVRVFVRQTDGSWDLYDKRDGAGTWQASKNVTTDHMLALVREHAELSTS